MFHRFLTDSPIFQIKSDITQFHNIHRMRFDLQHSQKTHQANSQMTGVQQDDGFTVFSFTAANIDFKHRLCL